MLRLLLICVLLATPARLLADWQPFMINYTIEDGLPSSECYYVLTDKKGYVWVATDYGISCYNGRKFVNYVDVLKEKSVILMTCDKQNRIWFISANGLFGYIENGKVIYPKAAFTLKEKIPSQEFIVSINYDNEGDFWIGTSLNIFEVRKKEGYTKIHDIYGEPKNVDRVWNMVREIRPNEWIVGRYNDWRKLKEIKQATLGLNILIDQKNKRNTCIIEMDVYAASAYYAYLTTKKGKNITVYRNRMVVLNGVKNPVRIFGPNDMLHFLFEDYTSNLFVTTASNGVYYFEKGDLDRKPQKILNGQIVGSMTQDKHNGYWFSTTKNGLFYIPDFKLQELEELKTVDIKSINSIRNDKFFITSESKILLLANNQPSLKELPFTPKQTGNAEKLISQNNRLVYRGLVVGEVDAKTYRFSPYKYLYKRSKRLESLFLIDLVEGKNNVWFGADVHTLYKLDNREINQLNVLPAKTTKLHYFQKDNELLIGSRNGLYCFRNGRIKAKWPELFRTAYITDIIETKQGVLCVATKNAGLFYLKGNLWKQLKQQDGLTSDFCREIKSFGNGNIILLTHGGINFFSLERPEKIEKYRLLDNLEHGEVRSIEISGDYLELATSKGPLRLPLSAFSEKKTAPEIYLSKCEINARVTNRKTFDFGPNAIRFYVDVLDYTKNSKITYISKLKGFNSTWKETNTEYLEYTNLPAGDYELLVSTRLENGKIAPPKRLMRFTVLTPFWQTWWFIVLLFLATVSLITGIIVWRIRIVNHREARRNELLRQIAESQVVALRAQMNPHFIFNAINSIQDFVLQNETEDAYSYLSKFARLIRLVMHQSNNNFLSLDQEIDWLKIYMELEQLRFKGKFEFELIVDPELELDTQIPNMLIQPHLENAIWHGIMPLRGKRPGKVRLSFIKKEQSIRVEIEDNGVGRKNAPEKKDHESSGIKLVTDRLERISQLENIRFYQEISDVLNADGEVEGTKVVLVIDQLD